MLRGFALLLSVCSFAMSATVVNAQALVNKGILVNQILARTRMEACEKGDLMHVAVLQPAGNKGCTVSLHAEYTDASGKWRQVPPPKSMIGPAYTSVFYGGLRDWAELPAVAAAAEQNVALFMPFSGFALDRGKEYKFRYVVRVWNEADQEISHLNLEPYRIRIAKDRDGVIVSILDAKSCGFLSGSPGKTGSTVQSAGIIRFFDTADGRWMCPDGKAASGAATTRR